MATQAQKDAIRRIHETGHAGDTNKRTLESLHRHGFVVWDKGERRITAKGRKAIAMKKASTRPRKAPKTSRNPSYQLDAAALYAVMVEEASHERARNAHELAAMAGITLKRAQAALEALERAGLAREVGKDASGPCWAPAILKRRNPSPEAVAEKRAANWNQNDRLDTKARRIRVEMPEAFVEAGEIVAIEYRSRKYDGRSKVWRHEVTGKRELHIGQSKDATVMVIRPPFKITKRGIEG